MSDNDFFSRAFEDLTGQPPMSWQTRLFDEWFSQGRFPSVIDLPTGLGKTMVIALWLIARAIHPKIVPTRLIYVVDRRTVVDQATDVVQRLVQRPLTEWMHNAFEGKPPSISTLRGQLADNREWSRDLSRPAIVIGTVDLIGSALLFSGYRSSFKRRPLEAGLLGQDSLLVLDEAHLSRPFEKLLRSIEGFNKNTDANSCPVRPLQVTCMSATNDHVDGRFKLDKTDVGDPIVKQRLTATKTLRVPSPVEPKQLNETLAREAITLAKDASIKGKRIVIFVRKPDDARDIADKIRSHGKPNKSKSNPDPKGPYDECVEVLTGTMRGLERDKLVEKAVFTDRWLNGDLKPDDAANQSPVFLVSTSAGEVGFDLNADHLIGDEAPLVSWIQRLGRVNRRGYGCATVIQIRGSKSADKTAFDRACSCTSALFINGMDVGPESLEKLKNSLSPEQLRSVSAPESNTVALTDILLDAWSTTSVAEQLPGRPDVGPWLRGTDNEQAQTTVAWRAELELFSENLSPREALAAIFSKHPIRPHESLAINTGQLLEFLKRVSKLKDRADNLMSTRAAIRMPRGQIICRTLPQLTDEPGILYANSTLILPATFGGLNAAGLLDMESITNDVPAGDRAAPSLDCADVNGYEQSDTVRGRLRIRVRRSEDGMWVPEAMPGGAPIPEDVKFDAAYYKTTEIRKLLEAAKFRVRLIQPIEHDEDGEPTDLLMLLRPASARTEAEDQPLEVHVGAVESEALRIANSLRLADDSPFRLALLFAARWHDEGKKAEIWQWFAYANDTTGYKGKSARTRNPKSLRGYRHEFGTLLRLGHLDRCDTIGCVFPTNPDACDLALHLIATHHGAGRPHFSAGIYDHFTDDERDAIHVESIRRFARLQRKYGWWKLAWLENLLRCADALASADQEAEDDPVDTEGEGA